MKLPSFMLLAGMAAAVSLQSGDDVTHTPPAGGAQASQSLRPKPPEPPGVEVRVGDSAPNFSYQAEDNRWGRLRDFLLQGPTLLVFGARDGDLRALDRDRDALLAIGVLPVAVLDARGGATWSAARRLALRFPVIPDARRVIAAQFNLVDDSGPRTLPAWFVVDRHGRVRSLRRGELPRRGYPRLAADALGLPAPDGNLPTQTR